MNTLLKKALKQILRIITLTVLVVLFFGCTANKNADLKRPASRRIIDIAISETSESLLFIIKGDQSLKYTAEKQISPLGIVIRFPDTTMDIFERVYIPPPNEVIRSVTADEVVEDNAATSYIFIGFQKDTPYEVTAEGNGLQVVFPKAPALSKDAGVQKEFAGKKPKGSAAKRPASKSVALSVAAATRLKKVTVTPRKGKSEIVLEDGVGGHHITLTWDNAPNATSYNIYWRNSPGVTKRNGKKITNLKNSVKISGLKAGMTYYFVVTTVSGSQESDISEEMSYTAGN